MTGFLAWRRSIQMGCASPYTSEVFSHLCNVQLLSPYINRFSTQRIVGSGLWGFACWRLVALAGFTEGGLVEIPPGAKLTMSFTNYNN